LVKIGGEPIDKIVDYGEFQILKHVLFPVCILSVAKSGIDRAPRAVIFHT
jgi:hypothetical protein